MKEEEFDLGQEGKRYVISLTRKDNGNKEYFVSDYKESVEIDGILYDKTCIHTTNEVDNAAEYTTEKVANGIVQYITKRRKDFLDKLDFNVESKVHYTPISKSNFCARVITLTSLLNSCAKYKEGDYVFIGKKVSDYLKNDENVNFLHFLRDNILNVFKYKWD